MTALIQASISVLILFAVLAITLNGTVLISRGWDRIRDLDARRRMRRLEDRRQRELEMLDRLWHS